MTEHVDTPIEAAAKAAIAKALRVSKRVIAVLCVVVVALAVLIGIGAWNVHRISDLTHQASVSASALRQQSIMNCENNNKFRAAQVSVWEKNYALQAQEAKATGALVQQLIAALVNGDPARVREVNAILAKSGSANAAETRQFLNYIKTEDAPKNCQALYAVPPATAAK